MKTWDEIQMERADHLRKVLKIDVISGREEEYEDYKKMVHEYDVNISEYSFAVIYNAKDLIMRLIRETIENLDDMSNIFEKAYYIFCLHLLRVSDEDLEKLLCKFDGQNQEFKELLAKNVNKSNVLRNTLGPILDEILMVAFDEQYPEHHPKFMRAN